MAFKPLCVFCGVGGFTVLKFMKGLKIWFYSRILNYTVPALLSNRGEMTT